MLKWIINLKRLFFMETTWENQWKIYYSARYKVEWSEPFIRIQIWYLLAFAYYYYQVHKFYETKRKTTKNEWRMAMEKIGVKRKSEKTTISRYSDMVIVLWQMAWCLCIRYSIFEAFNIYMKINVKLKRFYQIQIFKHWIVKMVKHWTVNGERWTFYVYIWLS